MNIAVIFAGGVGQRMHSGSTPKQFLELHGKPILVYTLEHFQRNPRIDGIVLVSIEGWIDYCRDLLQKFRLTKVSAIVPGGSNGYESISNGLRKASELYPADSVVLIHDGVRPLIDQEIISKDIDIGLIDILKKISPYYEITVDDHPYIINQSSKIMKIALP